MRRSIVRLTLFVLFSLAPPVLSFGEEIIVSAAASLTNAFRAIGPAFERANPGVTVTLNLAASGALLQQIDQGAPVDVFAAADEETMDRAEAKDLLDPGTRRVFARNRLVIVVPRDAGPSVRGIGDLQADDVRRVALGEPSFVPAGRYARQALEAAGLWEVLQPRLIRANSVRQVLDYVTRGEVDAGFVYATDATLRKDAVRVAGPVESYGPILYPIATVRSSRSAAPARAFVAFVLSAAGQDILAGFGFQRP